MDSTASATTVKGSKSIDLADDLIGTVSIGMLVKGDGIQDYTLVTAVSGTEIILSRAATKTSLIGVKLRFMQKTGLYYQILQNFGINQDTPYPELLGNYNFTTYCQKYALANIIPNYEIDEVEIWYVEETAKPSGVTFSQLSSIERYALGYKKLDGAQINIKKGLTAQLRIPLKSTGNLVVNIETKMRFI
jgi:hypothetical protein